MLSIYTIQQCPCLSVCLSVCPTLRLRMPETTWVLRHLKLTSFNEQELATVYTTVIWATPDYCAVVYHPMLTNEQDQILERLQAQALKNVYGYKDSYATMRKKACIITNQ